MKKHLHTWTISKLIAEIERIEFPEFQREPVVWGLEKKKRLIDSILRGIDISLIYLAKNEKNTFDCIDGQQRINAILSYLGVNENDQDHNGFHLNMINEVYEDTEDWKDVEGKRFERLSNKDKEAILSYDLNIMTLSDPGHPDELNLMFLRLQLGSPLRGGEKLHAMSGDMRDFVFNELAQHQYFQKLSIPNRRYARELVAAQLLHNIYYYSDEGAFGRSRFQDLQGFFRKYSQMTKDDRKRNKDVLDSLTRAVDQLKSKVALIKSRGLAVSVFLYIWSELVLANRVNDIRIFGEFLEELIKLLKVQAGKAKNMEIDSRYRELLKFQTSMSQATGDASSFQQRQAFFADYFAHYKKTGKIKMN